ncbi:hypothetical protein [Kumtagia ephedrae]|uniref:Uncharacterized protein n=1 Tax=Kumtagia ephedrae TaxID=2116701 RepID=A0A2P7SDJ3_9HYPH|nr:hypothetical protein [Mesorhizobium ephedrae]PSJ60560.1 hypothetical protein C7I84_11325 [Mesorhizobium ephedrae]
MSDAGWFAVAVALLILCLALGFRRWGGRDLGPSGEGMAAKFVLVSTAIGGLLGAPFWWLDLPPSFAWDLPPVASRMLAAAAFAFGLAGVLVLERPSEPRTRLYLLLIVIYLLPLAVAVLLLHLDRFDFAAPVTYGFFAVVIVLVAGALAALARGAADNGAPERPGPAVSLWFYVAGILLGLWGIALFLAPTTAFPLVFNWARDPLTSRLIAAMLFTIAAAFMLSRHDAGRARLSLAFAGSYGVGVVGACLMNASAGLPVPPLYAAGFAAVAVVSLLLLVAVAERGRTGRPGA